MELVDIGLVHGRKGSNQTSSGCLGEVRRLGVGCRLARRSRARRLPTPGLHVSRFRTTGLLGEPPLVLAKKFVPHGNKGRGLAL
jgi:hypothetical protein